MASVAELSLLLFALTGNIHAEELITIQKENGSYTFSVPEEADFCLISRFVGEEKLVLWNTSALWSLNSTAPEDLEQRLAVVSRENISSYVIQNLTHSDSGQYQEECWTEGIMTHGENISITVCSTVDMVALISVRFFSDLDLTGENAVDNLDVQWLKLEFGYEQKVWTRVVEDNVTGRSQVVKTSPTLHLFNFSVGSYMIYNCLLMNQEQCVTSHPVQLYLKQKLIYRSVEETAVLQCSVAGFSDHQPPLWTHENRTTGSNQKLGRNYSLVVSSLKLHHIGVYTCETSNNFQSYFLIVCPKFDPLVIELFSEGDDVTLRCRDVEKGIFYVWFMKSNQTQGRAVTIVDEMPDLVRRLNGSQTDGSLVISNVSMEDTGEYWCAVINADFRCISRTRLLLKHRELSETDFIFYIVRTSVLSGLLVVLCVVVVVVNQRTRRRE